MEMHKTDQKTTKTRQQQNNNIKSTVKKYIFRSTAEKVYICTIYTKSIFLVGKNIYECTNQ